MPSFLRRKGGGSPGGSGGGAGGSHGGGGSHGDGPSANGRRTRRGTRGGNGRNHDAGAGNHTGEGKKKGPGFWRRLGRDLVTGGTQGADAVSGVGAPKPKPTGQQPTRKPEPRRPDPTEPEPPKAAQPANQPKQPAQPATTGRQATTTPPPAREHTPRPAPTKTPTPPPREASHGRSNTMGIRITEDMSLQRWGRTLKEIAPAIDEVTTDLNPLVERAGVLATSVKQLATHGENDLPAMKPLVAEVESVASDLAAIKDEAEAVMARYRTLSARAETLHGMYERGHFGDEDRMNGVRGSRAAEKRADIAAAERDV
ncbi:hypothetical protein D7193_15445 [Micromonospora costi]|uniref:Uncharacterized protein n=2 Tax=Micromonospora costi TaxID=1530042 RepID=A0A3B0A5E2_9ACTN|nr:hypothetical protein D7193_15445 [Micromonospora costi]